MHETHFFGYSVMFVGEVMCLLVVAEGGVRVAERPAGAALADAVLQAARGGQVAGVVLLGHPVLAQQRVRVAQRVTCLCLHCGVA